MRVCPFVGIGSPNLLPRQRVCLPLGPKGGRSNTPWRVRGWGTRFGRQERKPGILYTYILILSGTNKRHVRVMARKAFNEYFDDITFLREGPGQVPPLPPMNKFDLFRKEDRISFPTSVRDQQYRNLPSKTHLYISRTFSSTK